MERYVSQESGESFAIESRQQLAIIIDTNTHCLGLLLRTPGGPEDEIPVGILLSPKQAVEVIADMQQMLRELEQS